MSVSKDIYIYIFLMYILHYKKIFFSLIIFEFFDFLEWLLTQLKMNIKIKLQYLYYNSILIYMT